MEAWNLEEDVLDGLFLNAFSIWVDFFRFEC